MVLLPKIQEAAIVENLKKRYMDDLIFVSFNYASSPFHSELTPCLAWQHCGLLERRYCILYLRFFCFSLGVFFELPGWLSVRKMGPIVDERACLCLPSASVTVFVRLRVKPAEYYHNIIHKRKLFKPFVCINSTP